VYRRMSCFVLALTVLATPALAADLPYLFQRLKEPAYRTAFAALFRGRSDLDPWVRTYLRTGNGVDSPGQPAAGGVYELYQTCEPHNCAGNFLYTLFLPGGGKAWALLTRDGGNFRFFGNPPPKQQTLLTEAARQ
jgi:hypothetical protein